MFLLVSTTGSTRGAAYTMDGGELRIGRDSECEIVLDDPLVSRRHCRLFLSHSGLRIEDAGSRNSVLVNGLAVREQQLFSGDELDIAGHHFIVGMTTEAGSDLVSEGCAAKHDTWSWDQAKPVIINVGAIHPPRLVRPKTIEDLVALYEAACDFAGATTLGKLLDAFCGVMEARLNPERFWVARVNAVHDTIPYTLGHVRVADWRSAPTSAIQQAVTEGAALLIPGAKRQEGKKSRVTTVVAPILAGSNVVGVIAAQTEAPRGAYDERDLEFLVLLARQLAPALGAVEGYEQLVRDNERLRAQAGEGRELVGKSPAIAEVRRQIELAAKSGLSTLIYGETGVGKDIAARLLHSLSARSVGPFVVVNCAAIPRELFESEVFGYERGAFTGAAERYAGLLERASGGTMFLDELADLSMENQARILRCVEDGSYRPLGGKEEKRVDVRFVSASNRPLQAAVAAGAFRQDLFHRLVGFEIAIPPLRERKADIVALAEYFFDQNKHRAQYPLRGFAPEALDALNAHVWPGNVRELKHCVDRAIAVAQTPFIQAADLGLSSLGSPQSAEPSAVLPLEEVERRYLAGVLRQCNGNVAQVAKLLGLGRSTAYRKLAAHQLLP